MDDQGGPPPRAPSPHTAPASRPQAAGLRLLGMLLCLALALVGNEYWHCSTARCCQPRQCCPCCMFVRDRTAHEPPRASATLWWTPRRPDTPMAQRGERGHAARPVSASLARPYVPVVNVPVADAPTMLWFSERATASGRLYLSPPTVQARALHVVLCLWMLLHVARAADRQSCSDALGRLWTDFVAGQLRVRVPVVPSPPCLIDPSHPSPRPPPSPPPIPSH